ncbi:MAG: alpha-L-fucosidase [Actinomycetota bacterium]
MTYHANMISLSRHEVPSWYHDAKFGIFIHWSLSSVPAFAPRDKGDIIEILKAEGAGAMMANQPYAEWYLNSIRIPGSPAWEHHRATYGPDYDYYDFARDFNDALPEWDPDAWAETFAAAGARYVVPVTKHHDGFLLWPSRHPNPLKPGLHATRDVVGELTDAVRARGMRIGYYYSSLLDWTFTSEPIVDMVGGAVNVPTSRQYAMYSESHWRELIERHEPSLLWSDIGYPAASDLNALFAWYYNKVPEGLVNDRWAQAPPLVRWILERPWVRPRADRIAERMFINGATTLVTVHHDYVTPEYATFPEIRKEKWECVRGMGKSFGYNRVETPEDFLEPDEAVRLLADIVSKNGNLLLNTGPMPGGKIPDVQLRILKAMGKWLGVNGEAIYGTRPWVRAEGETVEGPRVRFTSRWNTLYAILMDTPQGGTVTLRGVDAPDGARVTMLGRKKELSWERSDRGVEVKVGRVAKSAAHTLKITPAPRAY